MWLRLGDNELINLDFVASIKKSNDTTIEIYFSDFQHSRVLPFPNEPAREKAYQQLISNLLDRRELLE